MKALEEVNIQLVALLTCTCLLNGCVPLLLGGAIGGAAMSGQGNTAERAAERAAERTRVTEALKQLKVGMTPAEVSALGISFGIVSQSDIETLGSADINRGYYRLIFSGARLVDWDPKFYPQQLP